MASREPVPVPRDEEGSLLERLSASAQVEEVRYEIKLIGEGQLERSVHAELDLHPAGFRRLYPKRVVQSLYFDTHGEEALQQNLAGVSNRSKLRLRWYGDGTRRVDGQMELKVRRNQLGWKLRVPLVGELELEGRSQAAFMDELAARLPRAWSDHLRSGLQLSQWIRYEREYYQSADRVVRVTIDRGLRFFDLRGWQSLDRSHPMPRHSLVIVEAKAAPTEHARLAECVGALPLAVDRCSKFVMAAAPGEAPALSITPR